MHSHMDKLPDTLTLKLGLSHTIVYWNAGTGYYHTLAPGREQQVSFH